MTEITLEQADKLVDWTLARALEIGLRPITCCVTNTNAALKVFKAQEETPSPPGRNAEVKYRDPDGVVFDLSKEGWIGTS